MSSSQEATSKLNIRAHENMDKDRIRAVNLGGESSTAGAPVLISAGLNIDDEVAHQAALKKNPPGPHLPAQDPTPLEAYKDEEDGVPTGRVDQIPARGGPGAVRRVADRTPDSALASAARPYNDDVSAEQVGRKGQDTAEDNAEGKTRPNAEKDAREQSRAEKDANKAEKKG